MMWATARVALLASYLLLGDATRKRNSNTSMESSDGLATAPINDLREAPFDDLVQAPFDERMEAPATADESVPTIQSSPSVSSCTCSLSMWSYQRWPLAQNGFGCIGGCGGSAFQVQRYGATVRALGFWSNNRGIKAMRITFHDNHVQTIGDASGGSNYASFDFQPGEHCVGDLVLSGNGIGTRLGYFKFRTSLGRTFEYKPKPDAYKYLFPTNGAFMAGFMGRAGADIDLLGVVFWKPVRGISFTSISYPTLDSLTRITSPDEVASRTYCNDNSRDRSFIKETTKRTVTTGRESCLTSATSFQFGQSMSVKGGIPGLWDVSGGKEWKFEQSLTVQNCETKTEVREETIEFPTLTLPPGERTRFTYTQWRGVLNNLPFSANVEVTLNDGTVFSRKESGNYNGVQFTDIHQAWSEHETNVDTCGFR